MRYYLFLISLLFIINSGIAQNKVNYDHGFEVDFLIDHAAIDQLGNIFLTDKSGTLYKLDDKGKMISKSASTFGTISSINTDNSFKIFIFSSPAQQFIITDRFLSNRRQYTFKNGQISYVSHASLGLGNTIWLYDKTNIALINYNLLSNTIVNLTSLNNVLRKNHNITSIQTYNNEAILNDINYGIYVFDSLGNFKKELIEVGITQFSIDNDQLAHMKNDSTIHLHHLSTNELIEFTIETATKKTSPQSMKKSVAVPDGQLKSNTFSEETTKKFGQILINKNTLLLISDKSVDFYRIEQ